MNWRSAALLLTSILILGASISAMSQDSKTAASRTYTLVHESNTTDIAMMSALVRYLVLGNFVADIHSLNSLALTDDALFINGVKQAEKVHLTLKEKFPEWARHGVSYGKSQAPGTSIFFYKETFDE
jgi:hypothetical protein